MSERPQGPGWWLASDGRYYPPQPQPPQSQPQQAPPYGGYPPVQAPPGYGGYAPAQGQPYGGVAPPRTSGGGCGKAVATVVVVLVVLIVGAGVAGYYAIHWLGHKATDVVGASACTLTSNAAAGRGLGTSVTLREGTGLGGLVSEVIDSRVLPDAPSCWGSASVGSGEFVVRIAVVRGGDAAARYRTELVRAKGVVVSSSSDGQGASTTVSTESYYGRAVSDLGDEAFCTSPGDTAAVGILVRRGDELLYASIGGTDGSASGVLDEASGCARARKLAAAVLAG